MKKNIFFSLCLFLSLSLSVNAQFSERQYISADIGTAMLKGGDLNNDNLEDIVIAGSGGVAWLQNIGTAAEPVFTDHQIIGEPFVYSFSELYLRDFNQDEFLDIVAVSPDGDLIVYYRNLGDGQFHNGQVVTSTGNYPRYTDFGDVDGDGDLDMMVYF